MDVLKQYVQLINVINNAITAQWNVPARQNIVGIIALEGFVTQSVLLKNVTENV